MQRIFNLISPILVKLRYRNKPDPFKLFKETIGEDNSLKSDANISHSKILVLAPIRVSPMSNLFEGLIGHFFLRKGWRVKALMCNQSVYYCDNITHADEYKRQAICALCKKEQERFCQTFKIENISLNDELTISDHDEINRFVLKVNSFDDLKYQNYDLSKAVESGVTRYLLKSDVDWAEDREVINGYIRTSLTTLIATKNALRKLPVDRIILSHGVYSQWGAVVEYARKGQTVSYVWARGYVGQGNLIFGKDSSYLDYFISEPKGVYQSLAYSEQDIKQAELYFEAKQHKNSKVDFVNYYSSIRPEEENKINLFEIKRKFSKVVAMFTNIPWDGQIYNKTKGFPSTAAYIKSVISWFEVNPDVALVIRSHPAEADVEEGRGSEKIIDLLNRFYPTLPPNVFFVTPKNSISSYDVLRASDAAVVYGSSMALEVALMNVPLIQAGFFYTTGKDFIFEAADEAALHNYLAQVGKGELRMTETQLINAKRFAYYWVFQRHIKDSTVELKRLVFNKFLFSDRKEFEENDTLNFLFEAISENADILNH